MLNSLVKSGGYGGGGAHSPAHSGLPPYGQQPITPGGVHHHQQQQHHQTTSQSQHQQQQPGSGPSGQQQMVVQTTAAAAQHPGGTIPLGLLIDFICQRVYHELAILAELLPRKTDMERKQEIFNFSARNRLLAVRLLGLVKWASSAAKVDKSMHIMSFLDKQSLLFVDSADCLARIARETLVHARLPNFHIPAAVEVLTTGTYSRLPTCIREKIVPPDPITSIERKSTLLKLNQIIQHRLVTTELPNQMRNMIIENGRVTFKVDNEFQVSVALLGDSPTIPWKIIDIEILVDDKEIGDGMLLVHTLQIEYIQQVCQARIDSSISPLKDLYDILHSFAQSLQLDVLYSQVLKLCRERLGDTLLIDEYSMSKHLVLVYWKELNNLDPRAELGYKITIYADANDPSQPLAIKHQPPLSASETLQTSEGLQNNQLEKILVTTIHLRSRNRLDELKKEIELNLGLDCNLQGSPPVLSVTILSPGLKSEQLLVSINIHVGSYLVHIPQFESPPAVISEIQNLLNSPVSPDYSAKLKKLFSQLRYFITEKRCEKTLQHLPASASEKIILLKWDQHPILSKIGSHRLTIKFQKHPYAILIVEFEEKEDFPTEMDYKFYLVMVRKAGADENEEIMLMNSSTLSPKFYLKPITILPLDTYACTHGPFTDIDIDAIDRILGKKHRLIGSGGKRKLNAPTSSTISQVPPEKKQKNPPYFVPELAHIVGMCDERLPFALIVNEFNVRGIINAGPTIEAVGTCLSVPIFQFPDLTTTTTKTPADIIEKLHERLETATLRSQMQLKGFRTWNLEIKFKSQSENKIVPNAEKPVHFVYEMALSSGDHIPKIVENILQDWTGIVKLFDLLEKSNWCLKLQLNGLIEIKSFTWNKLIIAYGPNKAELISIVYNITEKCYRISFGGAISHNPHTIMKTQLEHYLNTMESSSDESYPGVSIRNRGILDSLLNLLNDTYEPFFALSKLPTTPQLGAMTSRPGIPVQTFVLVPCSPSHIRIVYLNVYCLDIHFQMDGIISIRDGAYSMFDKTQVLGELIPTQGLKAFLSKYVDENAVFRRRSQSEDDNPPSPITTLLDFDGSVGTPGGGNSQGTPSGGFLSVKPQSPAGGGRSNPHTPASPHVQHSTATSTTSTNAGFSPAASFANLASPPSIPHLNQQSPNPAGGSSGSLHHPSPSPSHNIPAPSPSGGPLSVPTPSPNPNLNPLSVGNSSTVTTSSQQQQQSSTTTVTTTTTTSTSGPGIGHPSPFFHPPDTSPAAVQSPWNSVQSPGIPRPSPMRIGQSPQMSEGGSGRGTLSSQHSISSRVLPQRSWAGAVPTILTHDALEILCTSTTSLEGSQLTTTTVQNQQQQQQQQQQKQQGYACSPLERFLGCSYLRRQLQRIIQSEENLTIMSSSEPGVILFRSETMHFRVSIDLNHFQSLHIKITTAPELSDLWSPDEIQLLENFFSTCVVSPPFRPNGLAAFAKMVSLHVRIIRDCLQIIRLQMFPSICEQQGLKWNVQLCLTVPPSAIPIIPPGMPAIVTSTSKILIYLHLTRMKGAGTQGTPGGVSGDSDANSTELEADNKFPFLVIPLIHEMATNITQLAEKRAMGPPSPEHLAVTQQLKRFFEFSQMNNTGECSIYPSVLDLLTSLNLDGPGSHHNILPIGSAQHLQPGQQMVRPGGPGSIQMMY